MTSSAIIPTLFTISITQNAHGFAAGNALAYSGTYVKAIGDTAANASRFIGFCVRVIDANNFILQFGGTISGFAGLVSGLRYFLDTATAGNITNAYPAVTGRVAKPVLIATSATSGYMLNQDAVVKFPSNKLQFRTGNETYNGVDLLEGNNITITQNGNGDYIITGKLNQTVNEINLPGVNISVSGGELVFGGVIPILVPGLSTTQDLNIRSGKTLKFFNTTNTNFIGLKGPEFSSDDTFTLPNDPPSITLSGSVMTSSSSGTFNFAPIPGRNRMLNGDFQWWKRGADGNATFTITNTTVYGPDRWQIKSSDAATTAIFTQFEGPTSKRYYAKCQRQAGSVGTGDVILCESLPIYKCAEMAGQSVVVSFRVYAGANYSSVGSIIRIKVFSGTGNADVSALTTGFVGQNLELNFTAAIGAVSPGIRIGAIVPGPLAANITQLAAEFSFTPTGVAGADDSFYITDIQTEIGTTRTNYDRRDESAELNRFCWKTFTYGTAPAQGVGAASGELIFPSSQAGNTTQVLPSIQYPAIMLNARTITTYNPVSANAQAYNETQAADCSNTLVLQQTDKSLTLITDGPLTTVTGDAIGVHLLVEAELL